MGKDKGVLVALLIALGLWGWGRAKAQVKPSLVPGAVAPAVVVPGVTLTATTPAQKAAILLAVAAGQPTVQLPSQVLPSGEVVAARADVTSIVAAAAITDTPVDVWLDYLGPAPVGEIVYTPVATGVYESALPVQQTLRDIYQGQMGAFGAPGAPAGGVFTMYADGVVRWQSDPVHPEY